MLDVKKYTLLTFKGICTKFLLKLKFFILGHPVTSKQPHKIVQIRMGLPVYNHNHVNLLLIFIFRYYGFWYGDDTYADVGNIRYLTYRNNMILEITMAGKH